MSQRTGAIQQSIDGGQNCPGGQALPQESCVILQGTGCAFSSGTATVKNAAMSKKDGDFFILNKLTFGSVNLVDSF